MSQTCDKKNMHLCNTRPVGYKCKVSTILAAMMCLIFFSVEKGYAQKKDTFTKRDTIHVIGHAHMDMNWLWTYSETMKMCNDNLRQTVAFMDEYPDFTMMQSQAAVYRFVEQTDPPLFKKVQEYVKQGRLELGGGMWVEGDENLSSGEAFSRSFLLGQRYFQSRFGQMAKVGWLPDNFGHISQLPQILKLAGCNYFYFHRCKPYLGTFWWKGSDSTKVLCYANDTYNGSISDELKKDLKIYSPDRGRILQVTGVGDHGGGPTRANIEMVHQLNTKKDFPAIKFTTVSDFFKRASGEMQNRPVHRGEMQFIFEGCYSNVSDIKEGNRKCENLLYEAEFLNSLGWLHGAKYPASQLRDVWETVVFNEFHDILPGSAINESNKESIARYFDAAQKATNLRDQAFRQMADKVKFQKGQGQPVVAFNLQPKSRKALVEASVYSHQMPATTKLQNWGNFYGADHVETLPDSGSKTPSVLVRDASGKEYPAQVVWGKSTPPGYTSKVQFVVDQMPAGGYQVFYVDTDKPGKYTDEIPFNDNTFESGFFTVKFNMKSGEIVSLYDKRSGKEWVKKGEGLNRLKIYLEDRKGAMKSWTINKIVGEEFVTNVKSVKLVESGPVRACIETVKTWGKSSFIERTYLYRSYPRIDYRLEVHWLETGTDTTDSPMLRAVFPLAIDNPRLFCQVPFDVVERPVDGSINGKDARPFQKSQSEIYGVKPETNDGQEVPAQKWVDVTDGKDGIALLNQGKYGHSFHNGELRLTLMRAAGNPDIYPNLGKFIINYSLFPHSGNWENGVWDEGNDFNNPVYACEPPSLALGDGHAKLPEEKSFVSVVPQNVMLSGMKQSEDGDELIVRLFEAEGKEVTAIVNLPFGPQTVRRLNLIENPLPEGPAPVISGQSVSVKLRPHEILTLGIK